MGDVARGIDPAAERKRKAAGEALTLATLLTDWQALHLASKRPRYVAEAVRALRKAFSRYLDLPAADLDRATAVKALDAMARQGSPAMAAQTAAYGKAASVVISTEAAARGRIGSHRYGGYNSQGGQHHRDVAEGVIARANPDGAHVGIAAPVAMQQEGAEGSTVCVLIRRLNSSCNRSIAFDVRIDFHWLFGKCVKVKSLSPASSRLSATALHFRRHLRMNAGRFVAISCFVSA
jgi:hypothetical protein